jgi:hypothetical protein
MRRESLHSFVALLLFMMLAAVAFADEHAPMRSGTADPSAVGTVNYKTDRNGNTEMEVKVDHLAPPANLVPPKTDYVVWVQAPGQAPENKGVLRVNSDQQGSIKMISPEKNLDVFVTAEDNPNVSQPSGPEVLRGSLQIK